MCWSARCTCINIDYYKWNKPLKIFYERLREAAKAGKVALIAVAKKLLYMLNTVMLRRTAWQDMY